MTPLTIGSLVEATIATTFGTEILLGRVISEGEGSATIEGMIIVEHITGVPLPIETEKSATRFVTSALKTRFQTITVLEEAE